MSSDLIIINLIFFTKLLLFRVFELIMAKKTSIFNRLLKYHKMVLTILFYQVKYNLE